MCRLLPPLLPPLKIPNFIATTTTTTTIATITTLSTIAITSSRVMSRRARYSRATALPCWSRHLHPPAPLPCVRMEGTAAAATAVAVAMGRACWIRGSASTHISYILQGA
mmetsp:Transcript_3105/g.7125  ORF Transcript_3105/g.7125 Transcript_3105/m.7125 type:complete len:110 (-) Transcript_3105:164-493(-)